MFKKIHEYWMQSTVHKIMYFSFLSMIGFVLAGILTGLNWVTLIGLSVGIICIIASAIEIRDRKFKFDDMVNEMKLDYWHSQYGEDAAPPSEKEMKKYNPFSDREINYIRNKMRGFRFGVFLRVGFIALLIMLLII